jgi:hypothetical protein
MPLPGVYLHSAVERRARLYESWASARDEGWRPLAIGGWPVRRLDRVLLYVHGGGLARDIARRGAAREQAGPLHRAARQCLACGQALFVWPLCLLWPGAIAVFLRSIV